MSSRSWVRVPHGTHAGLAQVAFGQTQAFHLWTWLERRTFHPEVPGSSPGFGTFGFSLGKQVPIYGGEIYNPQA